jgi:integrase
VPRQRNSTPTYRLHKPSGQAVCDFYDPVSGAKRCVSLGRWQSPESKLEHSRIVAEVAAGRSAGPASGLSLNELFVAFLTHAEGHYRRPDGTSTNELTNFKHAIRVARALYGHTPAAAFGPLALKAVRARMVEMRWARRTVNYQIRRLRKVVKFGVENELVPGSVLESLRAVTGLQAGRTTAKESAPVLPVDPAAVAATTPHLPRHVAGLVRFQMLTGCRPGEACQVRRCDIDAAGGVWLYKPPTHKMSYRGKGRVIAIGPKGQAVLSEFPTDRDDEYVFSPKKEVREKNARRAAIRKTKYYASRQGWQGRTAKPKRAPGDKYTTESYGHAVRKAVLKANHRRASLAGGAEFDPVPAWHPNQLRHLRATEARKAFGLEAAQVLLGHARADVTQIYAEKNEELAATIASAIG